jgi:outer membrane protein OmpA-like peptidoglycan-associated protein
MSTTRNWLCLILATVVTLPVATRLAIAFEQTSTEQIIKALKPPRVTRGLTTTTQNTACATENIRLIEMLRNRKTRGLTTDERTYSWQSMQSCPSIDLEINFEFNSAVVGPKAIPQITALGEALTSPDIKGRTFVLAGYTDAMGDTAYNQSLSEQRSDAVMRYLVDKYGIDASHLLTVGYGKTRLKNTSNPYAAENRRVQVVNVADN